MRKRKRKPSVHIPLDVSKAVFPEVTSVLLSGSMERKKVSDSGREKKFNKREQKISVCAEWWDSGLFL